MWLFLLEPACERNLDRLIETLTADETPPGSQTQPHDRRELRPESEGEEDEEENRLLGEEDVGRESDSTDIRVDDVTVAQNCPEDLTAGLRRRNRPE